MRLPIGSSDGKAARTAASLITTTGLASEVSAADGPRPRTILIPRVSTKPGVTAYQSARPECLLLTSGRPSTSKLQSPDDTASGKPLAAPADCTPGNAATFSSSRSK